MNDQRNQPIVVGSNARSIGSTGRQQRKQTRRRKSALQRKGNLVCGRGVGNPEIIYLLLKGAPTSSREKLNDCVGICVQDEAQ